MTARIFVSISITRRRRDDPAAARIAVAGARRKLEAVSPPGPEWERLYSLLLDYYRSLEPNPEGGGGEEAARYSHAAQLLPLIKAEWQQAWRAVTPFRR